MGTRKGGKAAAATNKTKYGSDFYAKIGAMGGKNWDRETSPPRGFLANKELARLAGMKGGKVSRRRPKLAVA